MKAVKIESHEKSFDDGTNNFGTDSKGKKHTLNRTSIKFGNSELMKYTEVKPASGDDSYFYKEKVEKDQIVLHFTMGYLKGDLATLTTPNNHVSVPFVLGRNGVIYNLFTSSNWSYHLGKDAVGGNEARSKATVGIEISNIGPLKLVGSDLVTYYHTEQSPDIYCSVDEHSYYVQKDFRGYKHYATFTDAQYKALIVLLRFLTEKYSIPREILPENKRYETQETTPKFRGIVSHVNYRSKDKTDIGPAFDWNRVLKGI